ncbi:MAG TPA: cyclic nucleotide-binding domain-containing protein [Acidimicrobiales bacterium]|nr:cyclic nucleotide-binding domain-containing protein [Acidimicrobiales bacterium]
MSKGVTVRLFRDDLEDVELFAEANRAERAVIRRHLTPLSVAAGRVLVKEGARGDQFMVLMEGNATVSQAGQTIATLERGDLVGEMALLQEAGTGRRNATVTASTDAVIYVGSRSEFRQILQAVPSVARKVRETAAERTLARAA